jgi:hypothetical protein
MSERNKRFRLDQLISVGDEDALTSEQKQNIIALARRSMSGGTEGESALADLKKIFGISGKDKIRYWAAKPLSTDTSPATDEVKVWDAGLKDNYSL